MKKIGYFLLGLVPLILSIILQFAVTMIALLLVELFSLIVGADLSLTGAYTDMINSSAFSGLIGICFALTCIFVFGVWYYHFCGGNFLPRIKSTFNLSSIAGTILLAPGFQLIAGILMLALTILFPTQMKEYTDLMEKTGLADDLNIFMLLYAVILAPIGEELIFRGVSLRCFRKAVPFWLANILQAILFGIFHMNLIQGVYTAFFALLLGFVCEYSGSIYYSILLHFAFNLWGTVVSNLLQNASTALALTVEGFMFTGIILGCFLFLHGQKQLKRKNHSFNNSARH